MGTRCIFYSLKYKAKDSFFSFFFKNVFTIINEIFSTQKNNFFNAEKQIWGKKYKKTEILGNYIRNYTYITRKKFNRPLLRDYNGDENGLLGFRENFNPQSNFRLWTLVTKIQTAILLWKHKVSKACSSYRKLNTDGQKLKSECFIISQAVYFT